MEGYSSDNSDSEYHAVALPKKVLDWSYLMLDSQTLAHNLEALCSDERRHFENVEAILLASNQLITIPVIISRFSHVKVINVSNNGMVRLPEALCECPLTSLIAKNNLLESDSIPKSLGNVISLMELNLSGNNLTAFPEQILELSNLRYLFLGGNRMTEIPQEIWKLHSLQVLYLGGNRLVEIPASVGELQHLHSLVLCDNMLESLPSSIANLHLLKSLLLHKNQLRTLPSEIIALKGLSELSLRDNPLVVRFVRDMTHNPPTMLELAARIIKIHSIPYTSEEVPQNIFEYLNGAHYCLNPKCKGVFFDNRIEHIKFVDFCGKYRIPLLHYLCSSKCMENVNADSAEECSLSNDMMKKVLLG
ncbi:leucine-rich repeat-containing protein 58 [Ischnura elegans]|uniref:leucine-rich repeat-containing protein 58 n=1 Tax=Ischnura elegans TaxID=197161 RepID=UPI001ED8BDF9|nr:leucine-rich repeat-containing protein 58 [Ischnura elegans]